MKTLLCWGAVLFVMLHLAGAPDGLAQGSLTPPGSPAPTMKTLQQVEPRIDVATLDNTGDTSSVYVISQAGSYYLSANLNAPSGKTAVHILSGGVTLDLRGFTISGSDTTQTAIVTTGDSVIRNGQLVGWGTGVSQTNYVPGSCVVEDLVIRGANAGVTGSLNSPNPNSKVRRCEIYVGGNGIVSYGEVTDCYVSGAAIAYAGAAKFTRCAAVGFSYGYYLNDSSTLTDCSATGGPEGFNLSTNCHLTRCTASNITSVGFIFLNQCSFALTAQIQSQARSQM
jgi:hypothetical protein